MAQSPSYRVFLSYSHKDSEMLDQVVQVLRSRGITPMMDKSFSWGHGFHDQIKKYIAHSHVFLPLLTKQSSDRGWVHQEIGYAIALNIPVLPICKDDVPGQMLQGLQALYWSEDQAQNQANLSRSVLDSLVRASVHESRPLYECATHHEDRTIMMVEYTAGVIKMGQFGHVYQKGGLSSFHIPDKHLGDAAWDQRYGQLRKSDFICGWLQKERNFFEDHARRAGCSLIINTANSYEKLGVGARIARLSMLKQFLEDMLSSPANIRVAINEALPAPYHLAILGDWFLAESMAGLLGKGYQHTIFTRHAPTIQMRVEAFERELREILSKQGIREEDSAQEALRHIDGILSKL